VATLFRNYFRCRKPGTTFGAGCAWIDSWNYYYNVVGKVLGPPGMTEWAYEIESPAPIDQTLYVFRFGDSGYSPYSWFGGAAWPPLGPDVEGYITELPAGVVVGRRGRVILRRRCGPRAVLWDSRRGRAAQAASRMKATPMRPRPRPIAWARR